MSTIASSKPAPLYDRVKQHIMERIARGEWPTGTRLPSEQELVQALGVSRMTVHRAMRELSAEGILSRIQGVGTFISSPPPRTELLEIRDIATDITTRGHQHRMELVELCTVRADFELASSFNLRPGAKLFHSVVVHYEDNVPIQLEKRYVTPFFAPEYLQQDFNTQTTNHYLQSIAAPTEVEHLVFAVAPDADAQKLLAIEPNEPCLLVARRTWAGTEPATRSLLTCPGSRFSLSTRNRL